MDRSRRTHEERPRAPCAAVGHALDVLDEALELAAAGDRVFPSPTGRALPQKTLSELMRALRVGAVPHGFLSRIH